MNKLMSALLAVTALSAAAAPALAQDHTRGPSDRRDGAYDSDRGAYDRDGRGYDRSDDRVDGRYGQSYGSDMRARYQRIEAKIQRGLRNRTLSYREGDRLTQQLRSLKMTDRQYRISGGRLTRWEQRDLEQRADRLEMQLRRERRDGDDRRY
jgi:Ni/Co efflux regulator RcnB